MSRIVVYRSVSHRQTEAWCSEKKARVRVQFVFLFCALKLETKFLEARRFELFETF